jgi:hypothetical protein
MPNPAAETGPSPGSSPAEAPLATKARRHVAKIERMAKTRQRNSGSFKLARVTMSKVCRHEKTAAAGAGRFEVVLP